MSNFLMGNVGVYEILHDTGNEPPFWPFNVVEKCIRDSVNDPTRTEAAAVRNAMWQHYSDWAQGIFASGHSED
eukprot:12800903-Prorocentrum_lima.AAC.1